MFTPSYCREAPDYSPSNRFCKIWLQGGSEAGYMAHYKPDLTQKLNFHRFVSYSPGSGLHFKLTMGLQYIDG